MIRRKNTGDDRYPLKRLYQQHDAARMIDTLNARLADALALSLQARQAHWNVKGPSFQGLHELFDKVYVMASDHADLLAERVVQLGGATNAVAAPVQSSIPAYPINAVMGREHAAALTASLIAYSEGLQRAAGQADEIGDVATLDIFSEVLRSADKHRWFVQAHLKGDMKFNGLRGDQDIRDLERRVARGDSQRRDTNPYRSPTVVPYRSPTVVPYRSPTVVPYRSAVMCKWCGGPTVQLGGFGAGVRFAYFRCRNCGRDTPPHDNTPFDGPPEIGYTIPWGRSEKQSGPPRRNRRS